MVRNRRSRRLRSAVVLDRMADEAATDAAELDACNVARVLLGLPTVTRDVIAASTARRRAERYARAAAALRAVRRRELPTHEAK